MPGARQAMGGLLLLCMAATAAKAAAAEQEEVIPATEAADTLAIVKTIEGSVSGAYAAGGRPALRDAHAKGHGCVRGEFTVNADVPEPLRRGVFAQPHSFEAWFRFSNGAGTPHADSAGDGRGMAIKLTGVPGRKLLVGEADAQTQDFVMINYPAFFIRNVADYVPFTALQVQGKSAEFFSTRPHEASVLKAIAGTPAGNVFEQQYFSMSPYLLGERYIKFSARPVDCSSGAALVESAGPAPTADPNYLRARMVSWLAAKDACFEFAVQPRTSAATQPVEDASIVWSAAQAPFIDVASIRIPRQSFDGEAQQRFCENLSFTPWHSLPAHRPVGGINRLRKAVYEAISTLRHRLNNEVPRVEPTGHETFP
jgi:catalase